MKTKKDKINESKKKYRENNREKLKQKSTEYYEINKERYKDNRDKNKDKIKEYHKNYYKKNKDKIQEKVKQYVIDNKEEVNKRQQDWRKRKLETDNLFKLSYIISKKLRKLFKRTGYIKNNTKEEILGCTLLEFKQYLENQFEVWMNWENKGLYNGTPNFGWDIDHKTPISTACSEEEIIKLNHYTNLQPLCSYINRDVKRDNANYY